MSTRPQRKRQVPPKEPGPPRAKSNTQDTEVPKPVSNIINSVNQRTLLFIILTVSKRTCAEC
jgi:hypothetical protein